MCDSILGDPGSLSTFCCAEVYKDLWLGALKGSQLGDSNHHVFSMS